MLLLQEKIGFLSCRCHSPVRNIARRQLGRHWCLDSGTQMEMLTQMERDLPALLWLSQQPTAQKGTQTLFPVLATEGWVPHSCPLNCLGWQSWGQQGSLHWDIHHSNQEELHFFGGWFFVGFFFFYSDRAFWEIRGAHSNSVSQTCQRK